MNESIPRPPFPTRQRRSAIGQAAQANTADAAGPDNASDSATTERAAADEQTPALGLTPPAAPQASGPRNTPAGGSKRLGGRSKDILLTLPEEEKERMVNTISWTAPHTGITHQSRFIRYAVAKLCAELEQQLNAGEPFNPPAAPFM